jgi:hypothetical protein
MTPTWKIYLFAFVAVVAVFAVAVSPITSAFAQETANGDGMNNSDEKTHDGKSGKSCPGKNKEGMST